MADPKLPQKLIRENPFKRFITRLILLAFLNQNLAFATQSIIELDIQGSQTHQRLHTILPSSKIADVSHVEIDTEQKQAAVYLREKQEEALDEVEKNSSQGGDIPVTTKHVILQKHDIINLPWDLEPEKLTLFILDHTAWLSPLDEDGYKLEFKGGLLGGMKPWGGGKKELVVDVTKFTVDCKGRNDYPSGTIGERFCNKNGNGSGNSGITVLNVSGTGGGGGSKGTSFGGSGWQSILGKGWAEIKANGDKARDRMQQQQENLKKLNTANQPFEIYKRKDIVIPDNPIPRIRPPQPVPPIPRDWEGKIGMIDGSLKRLSWNEMYYLARKLGVPDQVITDWRNYRKSHEVNLGSYLETKKKIEFEKTTKEEQQKKSQDQERSILQGLINKWQEGERNNPNPSRIMDYIRNTKNSPLLLKYPDFASEVGKQIVERRNAEIKQQKEQITSHLHPSQAKDVTIGKNQNDAVSVYVPFIGLTYPVSESEMTKQGAFLPTGYVATPFAEYLVIEAGKLLTNSNKLPYTENAVSIAYLVTGILQEVLEDTARSSQSIYTKDGFENRLKEATRLHHKFSGITFSTHITNVLLDRVQNMALSLGGSSKTLILPNFEGLSQGLNKNNHLSIYSAFTNLHYPVFAEDRGKEESLLPATYKPTYESEKLINYAKGYVVDSNKIKHHVEELQAIGYLVHEAMEQAVEDCRNGDAWDKQEFYTCLKAMTLHHLQMSGAEWVNTKMGGYFTDKLLPLIIYQAAFYHARIPENEAVFDDQVMQDWTKTDWEGLVHQVGKKLPFDIDPMKPHDMFNLEDKMAGCGAGGGKLAWGRIKGRIINPHKAQSPVWKEFKPYRGEYKTNGLKGKDEQFYKWDKRHNDIEVFNGNGKHLGSMDPVNGKMYKPADPKKNIKEII